VRRREPLDPESTSAFSAPPRETPATGVHRAKHPRAESAA
jgi:hypothetical protein